MPAPVPWSHRRLAWLSLAAVGLALALLQPGARVGSPTSPDPQPSVRMLPEGSPWVDRARLTDPARLILPPVLPFAGGPEVATPEVVPFPPPATDSRLSPAAGLPLALSASLSTEPTANPTQLPELALPLETLGERVGRNLPPSRPPQMRALALESGAVYERTLGDDFYKNFSVNDLGIKSLPTFGLGIDGFGLQGTPVLLVGTGGNAGDQAALNWARRQPWATWLPPGAYRVEITP